MRWSFPVQKVLASARLQARRKRWLEVHLWLGLALGLFLSIFGITGSILVFHAEINEMLNPSLLTVTVPENNRGYRPLAELFAVGSAAMPDSPTHTFATYPRNEQAALSLSYSVPAAEGHQRKLGGDGQSLYCPGDRQAT